MGILLLNENRLREIRYVLVGSDLLVSNTSYRITVFVPPICTQ